jgi:hypothetical protein
LLVGVYKNRGAHTRARYLASWRKRRPAARRRPGARARGRSRGAPRREAARRADRSRRR